MSPGIAMFALMFVFLGVGAAFLCYRQLHQTSALSVGAMEESYRDTLECTEEDITDKVGAGVSVPSRSGSGVARRALRCPGKGWGRAPLGV